MKLLIQSSYSLQSHLAEISEILDPQSKSFHDIQLDNGMKLKNTPCFKIQEKIIWGATSILLNELKHRIIAFHQPIV